MAKLLYLRSDTLFKKGVMCGCVCVDVNEKIYLLGDKISSEFTFTNPANNCKTKLLIKLTEYLCVIFYVQKLKSPDI